MFIDSIIAKGVRNKRIIETMKKIPRKEFIPFDYQSEAEKDYPLPIGYGQTISQPFIVAKMTELLDVDENSRVLEVGTGSGYQTAVLAELVREVYTIEVISELQNKARKKLNLMGYNNIYYKIGNGCDGWEEESPFDAVIVTCAPEDIPECLISQLSNNGIMCIPIGEYNGTQILYQITKNDYGEVVRNGILPVRFVPMLH